MIENEQSLGHIIGDPEREIASYTKQLAEYTKTLAVATKWLVSATLVIAFITAFSTLLATLALNDSKEQLNNSKEALRQAINESLKADARYKEQADLTKDALRLAERQANEAKIANDISSKAIEITNRASKESQDYNRLSQRAYVVLSDYDYSSSRLSILYYRNIGTTPAYHVRSNRRRYFISNSDLFTGNYATSDNRVSCASEGEEVIGAQIDKRFEAYVTDKWTENERLDFSDAEWKEFVNGEKILVISDKICYSDIFGIDHYTNFCQFFRGGNIRSKSYCKTNNFD